MQINLIQALLISFAAYLGMSPWVFGVGYFTLYRPLIGGTIVGLILGDVRQGVAFGAALNAVHLGFVSTGGTLPGDLVAAGYIGTALAMASGLDVDAALSAFGIPLGVLGGFLWFGRMTLGSWIVHWADALAEKGDTRGVAATNLWVGQALLFLFYALPTFVIVYFGQLGIERVLALIPERLIAALSVVGGLLPAMGIGLLLRSLGKWRLLPYFVIGFLLVIYFQLPVLVVALLGLCAAWLSTKALPTMAQGDATVGAPGRAHSVPRRVLYAAWWRWVMFLHAGYNYERLQGLGFAHTMMPVIEQLYKTAEERAAALKRHLVFFNTEPQVGALVPAVIITMEEERAAGAGISDEAINGVKSGLMGPLAGVGDSLFQGSIVPLLLSLGIGLAQNGSLAGPILYAILISALVLGTSFAFWSLGYRLGKVAVSRILASGWLQVVTGGASIVGMTVVGGLAATVVQFSTPASIRVGQAVLSIQADLLDTILKGLLPLAWTAGVWWLLNRHLSPLRVIGLLFVLGIDLTYLGLAGWSSPPLFSQDWLNFLFGGQGATLGTALLHLWPPLLATALAAIVVRVRQHARKKHKEGINNEL
jgi:PTS system mannose-specific IID component